MIFLVGDSLSEIAFRLFNFFLQVSNVAAVSQ